MTQVPDYVFRLRIAPVSPTTKPDKLFAMLEGYESQGVRVTQELTDKIRSDGSRVVAIYVQGTRYHLKGTVKRLLHAFGFRVVTDAEMDRAFLQEQERERQERQRMERLPFSATITAKNSIIRRSHGYR